MNRDLEATVEAMLSFSIICFGVILLFCGIFYMIMRRKRFDSKKHYKILGLLSGFNTLEMLSLSFITIRQIFFIWALFQPVISPIYFLGLIIPGVAYNALNRKIVNAFVDLMNCALLYFALVSKNIFYTYLIDVNNAWYVVVLLVLVMVFATIYSLYFYMRNVRMVMARNMERLNSANS